MQTTKEKRNAYRAKYVEEHREEWNEYLRNYVRNKYQTDPVYREKEKARKNLAYKAKKEQRLAALEEPTIE